MIQFQDYEYLIRWRVMYWIKLRRLKHDKNELFQVGSLAFCRAVKKYDETKAKFSTFLCKCIDNEMMNYLARDRVQSRLKQVRKFIEKPYEVNYDALDHTVFLARLEKLPEREKDILKGKMNDIPLRSFAEKYNVSYQRIQQLKDRGLAFLRGEKC